MKFSYREAVLPEAYQKAFKDADIRGLYGSEINEVLAYRVAVAFVQHFQLPQVIVARDMRESSPVLAEAFIAGVRDAGANVINVGLTETPALYYASGMYDSAGVVVTASHNPKEFNGLKLVTAGARPVTHKTGLAAIQAQVQDFVPVRTIVRGTKKNKNICSEYVRYVKKQAKLPTLKPIKIIVDTGNGTAALALQKLATRIPIEVRLLHEELDGSFPNRGSNPTLRKNQKAITHELKTGEYDFGVAFDGDADRLAFFDEAGRYINSAHIGALLADVLLQKNPGARFVDTVFTSQVYRETVLAHGGKVYKARVGHAFIKEKMRIHEAIFSCEHSAHFYFRDNFYADSGVLVLLQVVAAYADVQNGNQTFSKLMQPYAIYFQTEEVLVPVLDRTAVLARVADTYSKMPGHTVTNFDGLTVRHSECWFTVKKSVTEDALKFVVESPKKALAIQKQKEVLQLLQGS